MADKKKDKNGLIEIPADPKFWEDVKKRHDELERKDRIEAEKQKKLKKKQKGEYEV